MKNIQGLYIVYRKQFQHTIPELYKTENNTSIQGLCIIYRKQFQHTENTKQIEHTNPSYKKHMLHFDLQFTHFQQKKIKQQNKTYILPKLTAYKIHIVPHFFHQNIETKLERKRQSMQHVPLRICVHCPLKLMVSTVLQTHWNYLQIAPKCKLLLANPRKHISPTTENGRTHEWVQSILLWSIYYGKHTENIQKKVKPMTNIV